MRFSTIIYQMHSMNKVKGFFSIILLVTLFVFQSAAQQGWEAGAWIGTSHYFGDLNTNFDLTKPGPAGGVTARYNINDRVCFKSAFSYGLIQETDEDSSNPFERSRNLHFKSNIFDLTNQFEFNFMPYIHGTSNYFTPYFLLGLSVFHYEPKAKYEGNWYKLRELGTEGQIIGEEYFGFSAGLIYGAGLKWDISYRLSMNVEINTRYLVTDYLDDVSTVYPNKGEVSSLRGEAGLALSNPSTVDGFGAQGTQRGNSKDNDTYVMTGISFLYYFGQLHCPTIVRY